MSLSARTMLAHYEILEPIGKGRMGKVYRGRDRKLGRDVAIKVLPYEFARKSGTPGSIRARCEGPCMLNHPNISAIYGLERSGSTHYLPLDLAPGETLAGTIARGPIPVELALPGGKLANAEHAVAPDGRFLMVDLGETEESSTQLAVCAQRVRRAPAAGLDRSFRSPDEPRRPTPEREPSGLNTREGFHDEDRAIRR